MSDWKEDINSGENVQAPEEPGEDMQKSEEDVQTAGENMQIPEDGVEPMPPEPVEPVMPPAPEAYPEYPAYGGQYPGQQAQWQQPGAPQPPVQQGFQQYPPYYPQGPQQFVQYPQQYAEQQHAEQQPGGQYNAVQQPAAQYGAQQWQAPYPPYPGAYQPPAPPKRKMSTGAKVFLWIAGILAVAGMSSAVMYFALAADRGTEPDENYPGFRVPFDEDEIEPDGPEDGEPGTEPSEEAPEEPERPKVDVTPNTEGIAISPRPSGDTLDAEAVYNRIVTSTVTVSAQLTQDGKKTGESTGTGIIATSDGYIITNSHVVLNSRSAVVTITTHEGLEYEAVVVGVDRTTDLAVLKTNDHDFVPAEFGDADELSVGEWVLAIGNPGGARFSSSLTRGIISGLDREVGKYSEEGMTYIQTDAAINPGNSGGPLVNMYGQVVGINSSKIVTEGYEGMGFAIPVSRAQPIINNLLSDGYIKGRTRLGIMCMEISESMAQMYSIPRGLQITEFNEDCTLAGTEAQPGDIITAIEGERVESLRDVSNLLLRYSPGDQVTLTLYRPSQTFGQSGRELEVEMTLLEDKGETQD